MLLHGSGAGPYIDEQVKGSRSGFEVYLSLNLPRDVCSGKMEKWHEVKIGENNTVY